MTTDNKTLANAKPGGCVQLGDWLLPCPFCGNSAEFVPYKSNGLTLKCRSMGCIQRHQRTLRYGIEWLRTSMTEHWNARALTAQPSTGGQGDALLREVSAELESLDCGACIGSDAPMEHLHGRIAAHLAARQPVYVQGCDELRARTEGERAAYMEGLEEGKKIAARQPVGEPVCSGGFVISNGSGEKYMAWGQAGPEWTPDRSAALWLVRRADAEALAAENEDAWSILPVERCALPPSGWACTLASGHEGPCPTIAAPTAQAVCSNCDGAGVIPYTSGQTPEQFEQGEYPCPECTPAQAVDLGQFRQPVEFFIAYSFRGTPSHAEGNRLLALIDSKAVGNG